MIMLIGSILLLVMRRGVMFVLRRLFEKSLI